jgi:hypothetical protein
MTCPGAGHPQGVFGVFSYYQLVTLILNMVCLTVASPNQTLRAKVKGGKEGINTTAQAKSEFSTRSNHRKITRDVKVNLKVCPKMKRFTKND